jgi:hypothetical protein
MSSIREKCPAMKNWQNNFTFQKGDFQKPENCRAIANLNHLRKIYEKLMVKNVWPMMGDFPPSNHLHGFCPQHGKVIAKTTIFPLKNRLIQRKKKVILEILDMSAAFELFDKSIFRPKLRAHGFAERINAIYNDFKSDRKAVVRVEESTSEPFDQKVGCVQGISSGPLLFHLLVNNIYEALQTA